jgi:PhoH-like ATPase
MNLVFDTNALIIKPELLNLDGNKIIPLVVLRELDKLKMGLSETAYRARQAIRILKNNSNITYDHEFDVNYPLHNGNNDDIIIACAKNHQATLVSGDYAAQLKAKSIGVEYYDLDDLREDDYSGFVEVNMNDEQLAYFYENLHINNHNVLINQYIILKNRNEIVDAYKWSGSKFYQVGNKNLSTLYFGKFKPLDIYQKCAIDSLFLNDVTLLRGKAGSGKSMIALNYAMHQIEHGKFQKLVCLVNPVPVRNAQQIGFYKGDKNDKLMQSGIGNILSSKFGDRATVEAMVATGKIELIPMVDIRGYESGESSILWVTEGQNASNDLLKLTLQRVGDGSKIIVDGDDKTQVDSESFSGINSGIRRMSKIFRGEDIYGEMTFDHIYRSKIAKIADRM